MLIALALGWLFTKMDLTPLGKNTIIAGAIFLVYTYLGGFNHPIITAIVTLCLALTLAYKFSIPKDEDMDVMGAMCINDRGFYNPSGTEKPPNTQNCIAYFEKRLNWEEVRKHLQTNLFNYRRFSSIGVIQPKKSKKVWNTQWIKCDMSDPAIADEILTYHKVSNNNELYDLIDQLCNVRLVPFLPQWRVHYIDNLDGESAWVWRVSHGLSDGLRLVALATQIFEDINGNPINLQKSGITKSKANSNVDSLNAAEAKLFYDTRGSSMTETKKARKKSKKTKKGGGLVGMWKLFNPYKILLDLKSINDMLNGAFDTLSPFKPDYNVHCPKIQKIFRPKMYVSDIDGEMRDYIPLSYVKKLKKDYKVSVNDVLTALFAGAVRTYILSQNENYFKQQDMTTYRTNAMVAFGFPPKESFRKQQDWLKNGFTFVSWPIPVEIESFEKRMKVCNKNGKKKKSSLEAPMAMLSTTLVCRLGLDNIIEDGTTGAFKRHSCVFSNVPGPACEMYFQKSRVVRLEASYFNVVPQMIVTSFDEKIFITFVCDPQRFPNIQLICDSMVQECEKEYQKLE